MEINRIFDLLENYKQKYKKTDALGVKRNNKWEVVSSDEYIKQANLISLGLLAMGFNKGDKIATISNNRPEWNFIDMGMMQIGVIHVPVYPNISTDDYKYIFRHSEVKMVILSDASLYERLFPIIDNIKNIRYIYTFDQVKNTKNWNEIIEKGKNYIDEYLNLLNTIKEDITPNDVATIIYTSGTTGTPKGVMLTHKNIISNVLASIKIQPLNYNHKVLSFLPLCHIYERMMNYNYQYCGISIYYAESIDTIAMNIRDIKPHGFCTVPRLLEKVYDRIIAKGKDLPFITKIIFFWSVQLGLRYKFNNKNGWWYDFKLQIANKLVFNKWRQALGGNIKLIVCGGAALQPRLARIFWAARIPVVEGYGLTEASPVVAVNHYAYPNIKFGTVGPVLECCEVKLAHDGEILVKGNNVMNGYYKDEALTQTVIDNEGWLHTGDIGVFEDNKFLKITDRKKEIFKTSGGKYITPQVIENKLKESIFIENAIVVGENKKYASALICPNFSFLHAWCGIKKIKYRDNIQLIQNPQIYFRYKREVDIINKSLGQTEQIKNFLLLTDEWTVNTGELSPTLKLRRKFIIEKYKYYIEELYKEN